MNGLSIGQAAALYDLAPSTLRWWESQGVLPEPPRVNGRRVYTETELRRIGLAYLCSVVGAMPLDQAAVVTSGGRDRDWHATVRGQAALIEERIERLRAAHGYLLHLLRCPDDDIVGQCPDLEAELMRHTPRGRDEKPPTRDEICAGCAIPLTQPARGRRRTYCSRACRQRRYRSKG
ncbi:MerR family transcriptional regulator [Nonomuraea sp. NPDC050790]|uniref:helix-turn-helix domain-containing protein n=1 Tax=Nonomuraea sp. NPDC050790 TaxID=3364371 RepID=UPI0037BA0491